MDSCLSPRIPSSVAAGGKISKEREPSKPSERIEDFKVKSQPSKSRLTLSLTALRDTSK